MEKAPKSNSQRGALSTRERELEKEEKKEWKLKKYIYQYFW